MTNRKRILVAYDGSECADAAPDDLRMAGLPADAQIKVLSVFESWLPPHFFRQPEFVDVTAGVG